MMPLKFQMMMMEKRIPDSRVLVQLARSRPG